MTAEHDEADDNVFKQAHKEARAQLTTLRKIVEDARRSIAERPAWMRKAARFEGSNHRREVPKDA